MCKSYISNCCVEVTPCLSGICLFLNIIIPGSGTIIAHFCREVNLELSVENHHVMDKSVNNNLIFGLVHFVFCIILIVLMAANTSTWVDYLTALIIIWSWNAFHSLCIVVKSCCKSKQSAQNRLQ